MLLKAKLPFLVFHSQSTLDFFPHHWCGADIGSVATALFYLYSVYKIGHKCRWGFEVLHFLFIHHLLAYNRMYVRSVPQWCYALSKKVSFRPFSKKASIWNIAEKVFFEVF